MIIGIDGNEANVEKRVGIGEYVLELLRQFSSSKFPAKRDLAPRDKVQPFGFAQGRSSKFIIYLKDEPKKELPKEREGWKYRIIGPKKFWTQFALPLNLYFARPRPDVFFSPSHYAPRFSPIPTVISIMDLSYVHFPELFKKSDLYQLKNWTAYSVKKAKKILTISQSSKDDIIKVYRVPENRVVVTYPGIKMTSSKFKVQSSKLLQEKYGIEGDYVLFVGTLQPRKNIARLIEAFSKILRYKDTKILSNDKKKSPNILISQYPNISLIVVGKKGWIYEEILEAPKKFGIEDRVKFLDFVPDDDLPVFYKNALCFVLPSLYEGFGLPILEAMKYGCPVITSNVSSLPEAGGDAALYIDPLNVEDIASKMKMIIEDKKLREDLIKKGKKQADRFSWEKTARETLRVLESIK